MIKTKADLKRIAVGTNLNVGWITRYTWVNGQTLDSVNGRTGTRKVKNVRSNSIVFEQENGEDTRLHLDNCKLVGTDDKTFHIECEGYDMALPPYENVKAALENKTPVNTTPNGSEKVLVSTVIVYSFA